MGADGALILLYHRVTVLKRDPQLLCVSPQHFAEHLTILCERMRLVPLGKLVEKLKAGKPLQGLAGITFDDGYADNLYEAAPLLHRHGAPATIFATTGHCGTAGEFFWDDLERILLEGADDRDDHWTILDSIDPTRQQRTYRRLCGRLYKSTVASRRQMLDKLQARCDVPQRTSHRMMSAPELRQIAGDGLIEIGGHTVDHPRLSAESAESQKRQICDNKAVLDEILPRPSTAFSYPFGTRHDFTPATVSLVQQAGYGFACANFAGRVTARSDPFRLPRMIVRDWPAAEFERRIDEWIAA